MEISSIRITGEYRVDYLLFNPEGRGTSVLLHGFAQNADMIYRSLGSVLPKEHKILVPNGIFPLVSRIQKATEMRFSWYFYDRQKDHYHIPYDIPASIIAGLLSNLSIREPVDFIGFSQGGYLAPFCGLAYGNTRRSLCINSSLRLEKAPSLPRFPVHCLNGGCDELVDARLAEERFKNFQSQGLRGSFRSVPDAGHSIDEHISAAVEDILKPQP